MSIADAGPNTNSSKFYIFSVKTEWLDDNRVISGKVIEAKSIVEATGHFGSRNRKTSKKSLISVCELIILSCGHLTHQTIPSAAQKSAPSSSAHSSL